MCRSITTLFNFDPPASEEEIRAASLQFVKKITGFSAPSSINAAACDEAVEEITDSIKKMLNILKTTATPRNREVEASLRHDRALKRFGPRNG
jgi:hypothetical protein